MASSSSIVQPGGPPRTPEWCPLVSERLRQARQSRDLTLRALASQIGVSASLISQIETGKVQPSVNTLYALAAELELSLDELLFPENHVDSQGKRREGSDGPAEDETPLIQRASERQVVMLNDQVRWERLTRPCELGRDFLEVVYEPGGASGATPHRHHGREWGVVLTGVLLVELGDEGYRLEPGDSITFTSSTPHRLSNPGQETMRAIWFVLGHKADDTSAHLTER